MKKITFVVMALLATVFVSCQENSAPAGGYTITATLEGASGKAVLARPEGRQLAGIDTVDIADGKFTFTGKAEEPEMAVIQIGEGMQAKYVMIYLENEKISVEGKVADAQNAVVKGGVNNTLWSEYTKMMTDFKKTGNELGRKYAQTQDAEEKKQLEDEYKAIQETMNKKAIAIVKENNKAAAAVFIIANMRGQLEFDELKALVENIDPSLAENSTVKELKEEIVVLESVQIGKTAPDFTMNDMEGNPVKLSSLFGKGYLLIDFWAAWCRPCRAENPNVVAAYNKFNAKGFDVLGVSFDQKKEEWEQAVEKDGLTWTHVSDLQYWANAAGKLYGVKSIPHNVLVDKDGKIVAKNLRGEDLHTKLAELLGE